MNNEDVFICELCEDTKVIGEESDVIQKFARVYQVVGDAKHRDISQFLGLVSLESGNMRSLQSKFHIRLNQYVK